MTPEHMTDEELRRLTAIRESIRRDSGNSTEDAYADRAWLAALLDRLSALRATEAPPVGPAPQMPTREQIEALKVPKTYGVGGLDDYDRGYNAALSQVIALLPSASQPSTTAAPVLTEARSLQSFLAEDPVNGLARFAQQVDQIQQAAAKRERDRLASRNAEGGK